MKIVTTLRCSQCEQPFTEVHDVQCTKGTGPHRHGRCSTLECMQKMPEVVRGRATMCVYGEDPGATKFRVAPEPPT